MLNSFGKTKKPIVNYPLINCIGFACCCMNINQRLWTRVTYSCRGEADNLLSCTRCSHNINTLSHTPLFVNCFSKVFFIFWSFFLIPGKSGLLLQPAKFQIHHPRPRKLTHSVWDTVFAPSPAIVIFSARHRWSSLYRQVTTSHSTWSRFSGVLNRFLNRNLNLDTEKFVSPTKNYINNSHILDENILVEHAHNAKELSEIKIISELTDVKNELFKLFKKSICIFL